MFVSQETCRHIFTLQIALHSKQHLNVNAGVCSEAGDVFVIAEGKLPPVPVTWGIKGTWLRRL